MADLCPHRVPKDAFCKKCAEEKQARAVAKAPPSVPAARLAELEGIVQRGLETFVEVGNALAEIRDLRLYRETHTSFEAYLADRWAMSPSRGHRLIQAAAVAELVSPIGDPLANEAQARALLPLASEPVKAQAAIAAASAEGKPTAEKIRAAVNKQLGRSVVETPKVALDCLPHDFLVRVLDALQVYGIAEIDVEAIAALAAELAEAIQ